MNAMSLDDAISTIDDALQQVRLLAATLARGASARSSALHACVLENDCCCR